MRMSVCRYFKILTFAGFPHISVCISSSESSFGKRGDSLKKRIRPHRDR